MEVETHRGLRPGEKSEAQVAAAAAKPEKHNIIGEREKEKM